MERRSGGFSLLDVLLAVVICGIVAGAGVAMFDDDDSGLDAAARAIAADLLTAQQLAIETRTAFGLAADPTSATTWFVLGDGTPAAKAAAALAASPSLSVAEAGRLVAARARGEGGFGRVRIARSDFGGSPRAIFEVDGSPRATGYVEVALGSAWLRVHCQAASGRITVTAP
ncbi:MAG: hypothetical protein WAT39_01415 [Planctomycetota bacterium]